jgi:predicted RNase H-like HicB family nuclease
MVFLQVFVLVVKLRDRHMIQSHVIGGEDLMLKVEIEQEEDGRFIAEIPEIPGVMAYGQSREEALARVEALALRALADRLEHGEPTPQLSQIFSAA